MGGAPLISFVMLTWNSSRAIGETMDGIERAMPDNRAAGYEVIVVDNGSTDATLRILEDYVKRMPLEVIRLAGNMGTTYPRNLALKKARGRYICVMDSDVVIKKWPVEASLRFVDENACLLAPRLVYPGGAVQNSVKRFPTLTAKLLKLTKIFLGVKRLAYLDFYEDMPFAETRAVDCAISAFWLFPASLLDAVGMLDEKIFYSPEDVDWCIRVWKAGHRVYYYPLIEAVHYTQQISHKNPLSKVAFSHLFGLLYYFRKHGYYFRAPRF
ncbi:MAG: glycosyltransferase [Deltaproteobacteria bacterium]|nr:glycosyltransferase [Deltaproteobacteria bacterium]